MTRGKWRSAPPAGWVTLGELGLVVCLLLVGAAVTTAKGDELSAAIAAAEKAAADARQAADAAHEAAAQAMKAAAAVEAAALAAKGASRPAETPVAKQSATGDKPYAGHVECDQKPCKIDIYLTRGFRAFSQCQVCHGLDGNGSSFAPSLVDRLKEIDQARFLEVVTNGYTGQVGVMPGWKTNPNVMKWTAQLYAYLKARSDAVLPSGRLERFDR